jgi:OTU domain-containing protein 6
MDELLAKHRKEQRDLQSVVTQKKKSATKKTRKGVNEECIRLEQELKARQEEELAALNGGDQKSTSSDEDEGGSKEDDVKPNGKDVSTKQAAQTLSILSISSPASPTEPQSEQGQRKPNRQKARLARRTAEQAELAAKAEEEAASLPDLRAQEREGMLKAFKERGLKEKEVRADGHCLYAAVADQLTLQDIGLKPSITPKILAEEEKVEPYREVRRTAAQYIKEHEEDFSAFLEEPLDEYVRKVGETGEWGGQLELLALAKAYGVGISVLEGDGRVHEIEGDEETSKDEETRVWLAYYRHGFGLGEHYNSLRKG